jgi:hypothetical protein
LRDLFISNAEVSSEDVENRVVVVEISYRD